jgi:hypothetical protein
MFGMSRRSISSTSTTSTSNYGVLVIDALPPSHIPSAKPLNLHSRPLRPYSLSRTAFLAQHPQGHFATQATISRRSTGRRLPLCTLASTRRGPPQTQLAKKIQQRTLQLSCEEESDTETRRVGLRDLEAYWVMWLTPSLRASAKKKEMKQIKRLQYNAVKYKAVSTYLRECKN